MFNDGAWIADRTDAQFERLRRWRRAANKLSNKMVVIELGAGLAIPSVRRMSEQQGVPIVRINPRAPELGPHAGVAISLSALEALQSLQGLINRKQS